MPLEQAMWDPSIGSCSGTPCSEAIQPKLFGSNRRSASFLRTCAPHTHDHQLGLYTLSHKWAYTVPQQAYTQTQTHTHTWPSDRPTHRATKPGLHTTTKTGLHTYPPLSFCCECNTGHRCLLDTHTSSLLTLALVHPGSSGRM